MTQREVPEPRVAPEQVGESIRNLPVVFPRACWASPSPVTWLCLARIIFKFFLFLATYSFFTTPIPSPHLLLSFLVLIHPSSDNPAHLMFLLCPVLVFCTLPHLRALSLLPLLQPF